MNLAVPFMILTNIRFIFGKLEVSNVNEKLGLVFRESANFGLCKIQVRTPEVPTWNLEVPFPEDLWRPFSQLLANENLKRSLSQP